MSSSPKDFEGAGWDITATAQHPHIKKLELLLLILDSDAPDANGRAPKRLADAIAPTDSRRVAVLQVMAEDGFGPAQFHMASYCYQNDRQSEAFRWYTEASRHNPSSPDSPYYYAHNMLGRLCENSEGTQQNVEIAAQHYRIAAENRHYALGIFNYGRVLAHGIGVPQDTAQARKYLMRAKALKHEDAEKELQLLGRLEARHETQEPTPKRHLFFGWRLRTRAQTNVPVPSPENSG
jgi:TPR repeat protein